MERDARGSAVGALKQADGGQEKQLHNSGETLRRLNLEAVRASHNSDSEISSFWEHASLCR